MAWYRWGGAIEGRMAYTGVPKQWSSTTALPKLILTSTPSLQDEETIIGLITYILTELLRIQGAANRIFLLDHFSRSLISMTDSDHAS